MLNSQILRQKKNRYRGRDTPLLFWCRWFFLNVKLCMDLKKSVLNSLGISDAKKCKTSVCIYVYMSKIETSNTSNSNYWKWDWQILILKRKFIYFTRFGLFILFWIRACVCVWLCSFLNKMKKNIQKTLNKICE